MEPIISVEIQGKKKVLECLRKKKIPAVEHVMMRGLVERLGHKARRV